MFATPVDAMPVRGDGTTAGDSGVDGTAGGTGPGEGTPSSTHTVKYPSSVRTCEPGVTMWTAELGPVPTEARSMPRSRVRTSRSFESFEPPNSWMTTRLFSAAVTRLSLWKRIFSRDRGCVSMTSCRNTGDCASSGRGRESPSRAAYAFPSNTVTTPTGFEEGSAIASELTSENATKTHRPIAVRVVRAMLKTSA